jgi:hypothetical protein
VLTTISCLTTPTPLQPSRIRLRRPPRHATLKLLRRIMDLSSTADNGFSRGHDVVTPHDVVVSSYQRGQGIWGLLPRQLGRRGSGRATGPPS